VWEVSELVELVSARVPESAPHDGLHRSVAAQAEHGLPGHLRQHRYLRRELRRPELALSQSEGADHLDPPLLIICQ